MADASGIGKHIKYGVKWQAITSFLTQGISFGGNVVLTRLLSPEIYGSYAVVFMVFNFIMMFWSMGLDAALVQKKSVDEDDLNTLFSTSLLLGVGISMACFWGAILIAEFFRNSVLVFQVRILSFAFLVMAFDRVYNAILMREMRFKEMSLVNVMRVVAFPLIGLFFVFLGFERDCLAFALALSLVLSSLLRIWFGFKISGVIPKLRLHWERALHLWRFGGILTLANITTFFGRNLQTIVTGRVLGSDELGFLNRASYLTFVPLSKVYSNVGGVLFPAFSRIQEDREAIGLWVRRFIFFTYVIVTPPLLFMTFFPRDVVLGLYGERWSAISGLLVFLALTMLIRAPIMYFANVFQSLGRPEYKFYTALVRLGSFIMFLLCFLPVFRSLKGVVLSMMGSGIVDLVLHVWLATRLGIMRWLDLVESAWEPIFYSLIGMVTVKFGEMMGLFAWLASDFLRLIVMAAMLGGVVMLFYARRYFLRPYVGVIRLNLRKMRF